MQNKIKWVLHLITEDQRYWRVKYWSGKETFHKDKELPKTVLDYILEEDTIPHDSYGNIRYCKSEV